MNYAVMRLKKIKSVSGLSGIEHHDNYRDELPHRSHPDLSCENYTLRPPCYGADQSLVDRWKQRVGSQKIRKNAVLAYEIVLSFSPDALRKLNFDSWVEDNVCWLSENFGGESNILTVEIHLDETTPHLHAVAVPIDERGKLNSKHYTGTRSHLSRLQDSYAKAMLPHGLERGVKYYERETKIYHSDHRKYNAKKRIQKEQENYEHDRLNRKKLKNVDKYREELTR